jgi:isoleucyl-tRNA synthetase
MDEIRQLATLGRSAREVARLGVRQPLARMVCVVPRGTPACVEALLPLLEAELNVKRVELASSADALVTLEARPNFRELGKRFGKATPAAAQAIAALPSDALRRLEEGEPVTITVDGTAHPVRLEDLQIIRRATGDLVVQEADGRFAALDVTLTRELRLEGVARELVSRIQRLRKESGLLVSDRIRLWIDGDPDVLAAVDAHDTYIADEVLARRLDRGGEPPREFDARQTVDFDGLTARIALTRDG